jgi:hypothetical protein
VRVTELLTVNNQNLTHPAFLLLANC